MYHFDLTDISFDDEILSQKMSTSRGGLPKPVLNSPAQLAESTSSSKFEFHFKKSLF